MVLGFIATIVTGILAAVVYQKPELLSQRLPGLFNRRQTLDDVDYQELGPTTDREPLVS